MVHADRSSADERHNTEASGHLDRTPADDDLQEQDHHPGEDQGDDFDAFYAEHYPLVVRLIVFMDGSFEEAEDAVQSAMTELFQRWNDPLKPEIANPAGWVRKVAIRKFVRARQRDRMRLRLAVEGGHAPPDRPDDADPADGFDIDLREWVTDMCRSLPPAQREVLALIFDGLTPAEIAVALDKDPQTVRSNLAHARRRLLVEVNKDDLRPHRSTVRTGHDQQGGE